MARQSLRLWAMLVCRFARELNELPCQWRLMFRKGRGLVRRAANCTGHVRRAQFAEWAVMECPRSEAADFGSLVVGRPLFDPLRKSAALPTLTTWRPKPSAIASRLSTFPRIGPPACAHVSSQRYARQQPQPISQRPDHLNCGIGGTEMRGGGSGATAGAFGTPIWPSICAEPIKAPLADPAEPPAEPRANAAAGNARTTRIKAIFVAVFDIGSLHLNLLERRSAWSSCRSRCAVGH